MKLRKTIAGIAATAITAAAVSVTASASLVVVEDGDPGLSSGTGNWMVQLFNVGNEAENKPATDYGIDYSEVAKVRVVIKAIDPDWMDGNPGGAIIWSNNGGDIVQGPLWDKYNWPGTWSYWGVNDEALEFTAAEDQGIQANKIDDYTYELIADVYDANPLHNGDAKEIGCMQSGIQYWGSDMSDYEVIDYQALDVNGNILLEFDGKGKLLSAAASAAPAAAETEAAPAETAAPVVSAGDTNQATASGKGSPNTGIADVAAIAGVALVAGGAVLVASKKRK